MEMNGTKKELYQHYRDIGWTDEEISDYFGVKVSTIKRAIGSGGKKKVVEHNFEDFEDEVVSDKIIVNSGFPMDIPVEVPVRETITKICSDCGEEFKITPSEQRFFEEHDFKLPVRCGECRKKRSQYEEHICKDCGKPFKIRLTQKEFFTKNGLYLPQRCPDCISIKKERNRAKENQG